MVSHSSNPSHTAPRARSVARSACVLASALLVLAAPGCQLVGARVIADGRAAYNDVITRTGDEQVLGMIVKHRYDETFGMLDVASVTAQVKLGASSEINLQAGADGDTVEGNLVPFAAGVSYEDSPTISYVPLSGEAFITRLVAPVSLVQALTLSQLSRVPGQTFSLMVNRVNGLPNGPVPGGNAADFQRVSGLIAEMRAQGTGDVVLSGETHYLLLHDYGDAHKESIREMLELLRLTAFEPDGRELLIPIRSGLGVPPQGDAIVVETRSILDLIRMVADSVEVPAPHLEAGYVSPAPAAPAVEPFIRIRSAPERPANAAVAVQHRGWWFYIDATDGASKRDFVLLRAVISMGIEAQPENKASPVLTLPVR